MKLVILDRDGVLNEDTADFIKSPDECILIYSILKAVARLCAAGYTPVMATNHSVLVRRHFDLVDLVVILANITEAVDESGGFLVRIFYLLHQVEKSVV